MTTQKALMLTGTAILCLWPVAAGAQQGEPNMILDGSVEAGAGYVTEDSFKFGEYTGLVDESAFFIGNFDSTMRDAPDDGTAFYLEMQGRNLGLENRSFELEAGSQGRYGATLNFGQIPHYLQQDALTPYSGEGSSILSLPPTWPTLAANAGTSAMPLASTLRPIDLKTERERFGGGLFWLPRENWRFDVDYRNETKRGTQTTFGMFGENGGNPGSVALPEVIDYETNEVDATANYSSGNLQFQAMYSGSFFNSGETALRWENAYTGGIEGFGPNPWTDIPDEGQMALAPDNQAHNFTLSGGYSVSPTTRITGSVGYGIMLQDENFLPFTINTPAIPTPTPLPRTSLDGEINTLRGDIGISSRFSERIDVSGRYRYSERDNKTPRGQYAYVPNDVGTQGSNGTRVNTPHSFTQHLVNLDGGYRLGDYSKVSLGYEYDNMERTFSERDKTEEHTIEAKLSGRATETIDGWLSYSFAMRDGDAYIGNAPLRESTFPDPGAAAFENNPDLRKYNLADRTRNEVRAAANWMTSDALALSFGANYSFDDYDETDFGLTEGENIGGKADLSYRASDSLTTYAYYAYDQMGFVQTGSRFTGGETPPVDATRFWSIDTTDEIHTLGAGLVWSGLVENVKLTLDYAFSLGHTSYDVTGGTGANGAGTADDLPDVDTAIHSVNLTADYEASEAVTFRIAYLFEYYDSEDFELDNVDPDTMGRVLWFGGGSPSYTAHVIGASTVLRF